MSDYYGPEKETKYENSATNKRRDSGRGYAITEKRFRRVSLYFVPKDDDDYDRRSHERRSAYDGGGSIGRDSEPRGWNCLECRECNYPDQTTCGRCQAPAEYFPSGGNHQHEPPPPTEALDEFGRATAFKKPPSKLWPPQFELNGSSYQFDTRSGMFYEPKSNFFYDPTSKLYYGNEDSIYYSFNTETNKLDKVEKVEKNAAVSAAAPTNVNKTSNKKKISIKLKTKALPKPKAVPKPVQQLEEKVPKQRAKDMDKWTQRQAELKEEARSDTKAPAAKQPAKAAATTAKGEPICTLCRRKFPTMAKLEYHERVSKLHKENLAKQADAKTRKAQAPQASNSNYVDRAKIRRDMYGEEAIAPGAVPKDAGESKSQEVVPHDSLGAANIGHKMLQNMGWKPTDKKGEGAVQISQQWNRIESMSHQSARQNTRGKRNGGGVGNA